VVVSGRSELADVFSKRLGRKPLRFIDIPIEGWHRHKTSKAGVLHFPEVYDEVISSLGKCSGGTLVLVGAGVFGKMYCLAAKRAGAVSLDLGSAFDVLAGVKTRPVHAKVDIEAARWL
jgi:hypothetical protein